VYSTKRNPFRNSAYVLRHFKAEEISDEYSRVPTAIDPCSLRLKFAKSICRKKCETQAGVFTQIKRHGKHASVKDPKTNNKKGTKKWKHKTQIMGGKNEVIITEKVAGKEVTQAAAAVKK